MTDIKVKSLSVFEKRELYQREVSMEIEEEILQAKKKAMSLLQHMDRTEWEIRDKLAKKEFSQEAIDEAIEYVRSFHYIDDLRYATHFVEVYHEQRSIQRLKQDLHKHHVPEEYIDIALDAIDWDDSAALSEAVRKLARGETNFSYEEKQKMAGKLYRKGFRLNDIKRELGQLEGDE